MNVGCEFEMRKKGKIMLDLREVKRFGEKREGK